MKNLIIFLLFAQISLAQNKVFQIDSISEKGVVLNQNWRVKYEDRLVYAQKEFSDKTWSGIDPTVEIENQPDIKEGEVFWLRTSFEITQKPSFALGLAVKQAGASEVYLNGRLIQTYGQINADAAKIEAYDPLEKVISLPIDSAGTYTLAVRYATQPDIRYTTIYAQTHNSVFKATILPLDVLIAKQSKFDTYKIGLDIFILGIVAILFIFHVFFYLYQKNNRTQLVLAFYLFSGAISRLFKIIGQNQHAVELRFYSLNLSNLALTGAIIALANVIYRIARRKLDGYYYTVIIYQLAYTVVSFYFSKLQTPLLLLGNIYSFFIVIMIIKYGIKQGIKGFLILSISIFLAIFGLAFISVGILFFGYSVGPGGYNILKYGFSPYLIDIVFTFSSISIPVGLSLFMGIESSDINKALNLKLSENEELKNKAIEQEQEKQHILESLNVTLEKQVEERTRTLNETVETLKATQNQLIQSEKLASLGELTAGIAHEIQNPLNFVNNFSELNTELAKELQENLSKQGGNQEASELVDDLIQNQERISEHGKRASNIVKGMLDHSRKNIGQKESTNINLLAEEYLKIAYQGIRAKDKAFNADFRTFFDANLPDINVIPSEMGRVLLNLFNNAFYAVNERKHKEPASFQPLVKVSTEQKNQKVIIKVYDNGGGIPAHVKDKIFQPFFTTKPAGIGTGLGLSISYEIVTKGHNGAFSVETEVGDFTEFSIELKIE